jgi:hypothetical protein
MDVRLLWCEADGIVVVAANDHQIGEDFSVEAEEGSWALVVFNRS